MSTYTNQTVSSSVSVLGCNTLAVQNVTVASNGNLSLSAPAQITINGPFEVKSGGILNIRQSQQMILLILMMRQEIEQHGNLVRWLHLWRPFP